MEPDTYQQGDLPMTKLAAIVACGGASARLGRDKAQQLLGDATLIERAIGLARNYGGPIALAAREVRPDLADDVPILVDDEPSAGPISALKSGFAFAHDHGCSHVLLLACDQPFLPEDLAGRLSAAIGTSGVAMPVSGGHDQNMAALWRCAPEALSDYIAGGGRSLWRFAETLGMVRVEWGCVPHDPFADIDEPAQLAAAQKRIAEGGAGPEQG